jgi:tetratricopeptide (TPR) repeat protein
MAAADDDEDVGVVEIMPWLFSLSPNPANKFEHYAIGGHGVEMFAAHKELPGEIATWLGSTLSARPAAAAAKTSAPAPRETRFLELLDHPGGVSKAAEMFAQARQRDPKAVLFSEGVMNRVGYEHLQAGDTKGAVEILKMNVTAYPNSANVYDSVSDAYLADGQKDLALLNAKTALERLAADTSGSEARRDGIKISAEQKVKELGEAPH